MQTLISSDTVLLTRVGEVAVKRVSRATPDVSQQHDSRSVGQWSVIVIS